MKINKYYCTKSLLVGFMLVVISTLQATDWDHGYNLTVLPPEHRIEQDKNTGAQLLFLTSDSSNDINLYYHQRSWLSNSSAILFYSDRDPRGVYAYWVKTGELLHLTGPDGAAFTGITASVFRNTVYAVWNNKAVEINFHVLSDNKKSSDLSKAQGRIRVICELKPNNRRYSLNESCDGQYLAYDTMGHGKKGGPQIFIVNVESGEQRELVSLPPDRGSANHVQWSRTNPKLLSLSSLMEPYKFRAGPRTSSDGPTDYLGRCQKLWVIDIDEGEPVNVYQAIENELVTHAIWWINDTILFTGAVKVPAEDSWAHVKMLDVKSGDVRIVGAGSWWPDATPEEMSRSNWWHPSGSDDGRWIVADNWHGDIQLFEGQNSRPHLLTGNHRTYGSGDHPHPGWDRKGDQVVFTSHKLGSADVCVATIPQAFQNLVRANTDGFGNPALHHKIVPQGQTLLVEDFENLDRWHLEGFTKGISLLENGELRLDCTGSQQGGIGVHAFLKQDLPDNICLEYDLFTEEKNGLILTFLGFQGVNGEDAIAGVPPRSGKFIDYTGKNATTRSYHLSLSRYNDKGEHTGVSNWRRNPGLNLVGQGSDPCKKIGKTYHIAIIKQGPLCQLQVDGKVISGFVDETKSSGLIPRGGKIGFRVIGAKAIVHISNLHVAALE
jgi:hypothetical protein